MPFRFQSVTHGAAFTLLVASCIVLASEAHAKNGTRLASFFAPSEMIKGGPPISSREPEPTRDTNLQDPESPPTDSANPENRPDPEKATGKEERNAETPNVEVIQFTLDKESGTIFLTSETLSQLQDYLGEDESEGTWHKRLETIGEWIPLPASLLGFFGVLIVMVNLRRLFLRIENANASIDRIVKEMELPPSSAKSE